MREIDPQILGDIRDAFQFNRNGLEWLRDRVCHDTPELKWILAMRERHGRNVCLGAIMYHLLSEKMGYSHREFANSEAAHADLQWLKFTGEITSDEIVAIKAYCNVKIHYNQFPFLQNVLEY